MHKDRLTPDDVAGIARCFEQSLQQLGTDRVEALLVHHADDLLCPGGDLLHLWLLDQQAAGRIGRIGVSVYDRQQILAVLDKFDIQLLQLPASIADQRLLQDGTIKMLARAGIEIHVRSLYLQGLLLAKEAFVAARFPLLKDWIRAFRTECSSRGISALQACIGFFRSQASFDVAVVGATKRSRTVRGCERRYWLGTLIVSPKWAAACQGQRGS